MKSLADKIDAILPQTQCGLCTFKGCKPYAEALAAEKAEINLCPPGGVQGLITIAQLMGKDPEPFFEDMTLKQKLRTRAVIREAECIGCKKCINACPVDAIVGSGKLMHTVIADECTGCELCIAPCPVDCIDMVPVSELVTESERANYRKRYYSREERLSALKKKSDSQDSGLSLKPEVPTHSNALLAKKNYIAAALSRVKDKKNPPK